MDITKDSENKRKAVREIEGRILRPKNYSLYLPDQRGKRESVFLKIPRVKKTPFSLPSSLGHLNPT